MSATRTHRIEVQWQDLFKPVQGLKTGPREDPLTNEIVVIPEIVPIVFVPGIMGSRLKYATGKNHKAWDPDSPGMMVSKYGIYCPPDRRKASLVGKQSHQKDYLRVDRDSKKVPQDKKGLGWDGVAWDFYGNILKILANNTWPDLINVCFDLPVYAFGYNWTCSNHDSGRELSKFIDAVIEENNTWTVCRQVILVTHSMGGLVARSACKLHGAESKVLGVVHGAQPAYGAPAAYQRMKHGFRDLNGSMWDWLVKPVDKIAQRVLGNNGKAVTILLANMPGGLELLPNQLYTTNDGSAQWLHCTDHRGAQVALPRSDPYSEIYEEQDAAWRLVNPKWLSGDKVTNKGKQHEQEELDPWNNNYTTNLSKAQNFHTKLAGYVHNETYQFYATGIHTADRVLIGYRKHMGQHLSYLKSSEGKIYFDLRDDQNRPIDPEEDPWLDDPMMAERSPWVNQTIYAYNITPPTGLGDGTVPDSSGRALPAKPQSYTKGPDGTVEINDGDEKAAGRSHDKIYNTRTAQQITLKAIENLCKFKIKKETGI